MWSLGLSPLPRAQSGVLVVMLVGVAALGTWFYLRQARGAMGGRISPAKALWLCFAILYWLGVCPLLALSPQLPTTFRLVLGVFALSFWLRGLVELFMMYATKNWRPPYGIAHDVFSIALVAGTWWLVPATDAASPWYTMGQAATAALLLSLSAETYYAHVFHRLVEGQTTGDDGVWFADAEDPKFRTINRLTSVINVPLYGYLCLLCTAALGGLR